MGDAAEQKGADEQIDEVQPKSKLPIIIGGLGVVLIIILAIVAMLRFGSNDESPLKIEPKPLPGYMLKFPQPFVTNLSPPDNAYLFSVDITLEIKYKDSGEKKKGLKEIGEEPGEDKEYRMPAILDAINGVLASKTRSEVSSGGGREKIKIEITKKINGLLEFGKVDNVYMYQYNVN